MQNIKKNSRVAFQQPSPPPPPLYHGGGMTLHVRPSGGSRPSDKGGGPGHSDPEIRGEPGLQIFFSALRASVWSKNKVGGCRVPRAPPLDPPPRPKVRRYGKKVDMSLKTYSFLLCRKNNILSDLSCERYSLLLS